VKDTMESSNIYVYNDTDCKTIQKSSLHNTKTVQCVDKILGKRYCVGRFTLMIYQALNQHVLQITNLILVVFLEENNNKYLPA
jgi:hypothetical protein